MHDHLAHLIQTVRMGQATGLALTFAAMRAQVTAGVIDRATFDALAQGCQDLLRTVRQDDHAQLSIPLDPQSSVHVDLSTNWIKTHYTLHFTPAPAYAERWLTYYPQILTIARRPSGPI